MRNMFRYFIRQSDETVGEAIERGIINLGAVAAAAAVVVGLIIQG